MSKGIQVVEMLAEKLGGDVEDVGILPDGSGYATVSMPLSKDHWLYKTPDALNVPPMPFRCGTDAPNLIFNAPDGTPESDRVVICTTRKNLQEGLREAAKYALRSATMNGQEMDFDPDAVVQNLLVGFLGYCTPDGFFKDDWANPTRFDGGDKDR